VVDAGGIPRRGVAAQVEFESKFEAKLKIDLSYFSFKRLVPGAFNVGLIGQPAPPCLGEQVVAVELEVEGLAVAAQLEIESNRQKQVVKFQFQALRP